MQVPKNDPVLPCSEVNNREAAAAQGGDCSHLVLVPALLIKRDFLNDL